MTKLIPIQEETIALIRLIKHVLNEKEEKLLMEFIIYGEWGLAYEDICEIIKNERIGISSSDYQTIRTLGEKMEIDEQNWLKLNHLIIN